MKIGDFTVQLTASGLFTRLDRELGMLVFSPYTGLMFAVHSDDVQGTLDWLRGDGKAPGEKIRQALGMGWDKSIIRGDYPWPHYLADRGQWEVYPAPAKFPILINWFLTGKCPLACQYCDARDLMITSSEPSLKDMKLIADRILTYNPIAVVLTGGEPLASPFIEECVRFLHGRTGIMVDTNGLFLNDSMVRLFKEKSVVVRISIDSAIPRVNDGLRRLGCDSNGIRLGSDYNISSLKVALQAVTSCLDAGIPITVQTVASRKNWNDLIELGTRLYRLGVQSWRVHLVALQKNTPIYRLLAVPLKSRVEVLHRLRNIRFWQGMDFQLVDDASRDSVVLVSPDGRYLFESEAGLGKKLIDPAHPCQPDPDQIFKKVSAQDHAKRYLGQSDSLLGRWLSE
jgi:MoaA/NifB/PqqE/SkfB family radical SAM enzyme